MPAQHATLSASASHRWIACPGSIALSNSLPEAGSGNAASREGTMLHAVLEHCLRTGATPDAVKVSGYSLDTDTNPVAGDTGDYELTPDQVDAVDVALSVARSLPGVVVPEMRISYGTAIGQPNDVAWGTCDIHSYDDGTVYVCDAKFGRGFVGATDNTQMLLYAAGVVEALELLGSEVHTVDMRIVQPFIHNHDSQWVISREQLRERVEGAPKASAALAMQAIRFMDAMPQTDASVRQFYDQFVSAGTSQCKWCKAKPVCRKAQQFAETAAMSNMSAYHGTITDALDMIPFLEGFIADVRNHALQQALGGETVPGYKLVVGREGNRRYEDEAKAAQSLRQAGMTDDVIMSEPALKTPAQLEKALAKSMGKEDAKATVDRLCVRNPAKPALVPADDPRPAWSKQASEDEFDVL